MAHRRGPPEPVLGGRHLSVGRHQRTAPLGGARPRCRHVRARHSACRCHGAGRIDRHDSGAPPSPARSGDPHVHDRSRADGWPTVHPAPHRSLRGCHDDEVPDSCPAPARLPCRGVGRRRSAAPRGETHRSRDGQQSRSRRSHAWGTACRRPTHDAPVPGYPAPADHRTPLIPGAAAGSRHHGRDACRLQRSQAHPFGIGVSVRVRRSVHGIRSVSLVK